jgi:hypothetical protein
MWSAARQRRFELAVGTHRGAGARHSKACAPQTPKTATP